jgi:hypothetical protein
MYCHSEGAQRVEEFVLGRCGETWSTLLEHLLKAAEGAEAAEIAKESEGTRHPGRAAGPGAI